MKILLPLIKKTGFVFLVTLLFAFAQKSFGQTNVFSENFDESQWNGTNSTQSPAPTLNGWTSDQTASSTSAWHRNDYTTNWSHPGNGSPASGGAASTTYYARFHSYYISNGSTASLISPTIDMSAYSSATLTFYYINPSGSDVLNVYFYNGTSYSSSQATKSTISSWTQYSVTIPVAYLVSGFKVKFTATSDFGNDDIGLDQVAISAIHTSALSSSVPSLPAFANTVSGNVSATQTFSISGTNLSPASGNITVAAPSGFLVYNGSAWVSSYTIPYTGGALSSATISAEFTPTTNTAYSGSINITGGGDATPPSVSVNGTGTASANSDIITAGNEAASIDASKTGTTISTAAGATRVWSFTVRDGGGSSDLDNLNTVLNAVTIGAGSGNGLTWSNTIQAAALFNGSTLVATGTLSGNSIVFSGLSGVNVTAIDGGANATLDLYLTFKTGTIADDQQLQFQINSATVASSGSSAFGSFTATSSVAGTNNKINIIATKLSFSQQPPASVIAGVAMSPAVAVKAVDANNNTDLDYATAVSITTTATFAGSSTLTAIPVSGVASFNNLVFAATGSNFTLAGTSGILTASGNSTPFAVTASASSNIIVKTGYVYPQNIAYQNYLSSNITTGNTAGSLEIAQFTIQDGGGSADADNLSTSLSTVSFTLSNYANIQKIAIYDPSTGIVLMQAAGASTINFSGLNLIAADGSSKDFSILVSFNSTVTDDQHIGLTIASATAASTGSGFAAANAGGATTSVAGNDNKISVSATKIIFVQQPSNVLSGSTMTPSVTIKTVDANNNTDLDYATSVVITTTANFSGTAITSVTPSSGIATFSNLVFSGAGTGFTLAGTSGSLIATGNSNPFNVTASAASKVIAASSYTYSSNISYSNYLSASGLTTATSIGAMGLTLQDGGGSTDADNLPTTLTAISFTTGSSTAIRTAALFVAGSPVAEVAVNGATSISFPSVLIIAADNGNTAFELRVTYQSAVTDQQQIQFAVSSVSSNSTGSAFAAANGSGALSSISSSSYNKIVVTATKLVFIQQTSDVAQDDAMSPSVTIKEVDALGNTDIHDNTLITLSTTGVFTSNATKAVTPVSGVSTFNNLIFNTIGNFTIAGAAGSLLATGNSNSFNVTAFVSRAADYFKSAASADWAQPSTWIGSHDNVNFYTPTSYPTSSATSIAIQSGTAIAVSTTVSGAGITVPAAASININAGSLSIANGSGTDLSVTGSGIVNVNFSGTLINSGTISSGTSTLVVANGGTYQHAQNGGAIPAATWGVSSNCNITGITTSAPSGLTAAFGNVTWNCTGQVYVDDGFGLGVDQGVSIGTVTTNGSFNLKSTGSSFINIATLTVKGAYVQTGGTIVDFSNAFTGSTTGTLNVAGDFTISAGTMGANSANNNATFNVFFNGNAVQHFVKTGGFINTTSQFFTSGTMTNKFTINSGAIVDFSTYSLNGTGNFALSSGASIISANANGIGTSGSIQLTGTKTFDPAANYTFNGTGIQVTSTSLPASLTGNLTISNTNTSTGVTLSNTAQTVSGTLNIAAGSILTLPTTVSTTTFSGVVNANNTGIINPGTSSTLIISGTISNPVAFGSGTFTALTLNHAGSVLTLASALNTGTLNLTNGKIDASAFGLTVTGSSAIAGASSTNYVITGNGSGNGYLQINNLTAGTSYNFPIGTSSYYLPASINPSSANLNWAAKVYPFVTSDGSYNPSGAYSGSALSSVVNAEWDITPKTAANVYQSNSAASITLNWQSALEGPVFSTYVDSYIGISHYTSNAWQGGKANGGASNSGNYVTATFTSFSPFGIGSINNPLPVVLVDFNAELNSNKTVDVSWTTQQEVNSSHFDIERSADGISWETIGSVEAKGNSALPSDYTFNDPSPLMGTNYYRLKMVNINDAFGFTTVKVVRTLQVKGINIFPNPARSYVNVSVSQAATDLNIRLISQSGQVMQTAKINAGSSTTLTLQVSNYPQGTYILQISAPDGTKQTSKIVIMR